ncbi:phostensin isoform X2 [Arapaima gigas]
MSVSSLPEWKQLLLDRKRREEEVRERQEREEQERLASMPAWKRGIIQRRRAKQEGDGEREKESSTQAVDIRAAGQSMSERVMPAGVQLGDTAATRENIGPESQSQVSVETIGPVRHNPFLLAQSRWKKKQGEESGGEVVHEHKNSREIGVRRGAEEELGSMERERVEETSRWNNRGYNRECGRKKDQEVPLEWQVGQGDCGDRGTGTCKGRVIPREREQHNMKRRQGVQGDESDSDVTYPLYPLPLVPCLHTIRAENIIIIEKETNTVNRVEQREKESMEKTKQWDGQERRGMTVDIRDILAGGGSVTEIKASEVLIIKPISDVEDKSRARKFFREKGEGRMLGSGVNQKREEGERETFACKEQEKEALGGEKEGRSSSKVTVGTQKVVRVEEVEKNAGRERRESEQDEKFPVETAGRVSQLLSKFGELQRTPSRSKSTDSLNRPERVGAKWNAEEDLILANRNDQIQGREQTEHQEERGISFRGVPKRSFSFSDRVVCSRENGGEEEEDYTERRVIERTHSDRQAMQRGSYRETGILKGGQWDTGDGGDRGFSESTLQGVAGMYEEIVLGPERNVENIEEKFQSHSGTVKLLRKEQKQMSISSQKDTEWEDRTQWKKEQGKEGGFTDLSSKKADIGQHSQAMSSRQDKRVAETDTGGEISMCQDVQRESKSSFSVELEKDPVLSRKEREMNRTVPEAVQPQCMDPVKGRSHHLREHMPRDDSAFREGESCLHNLNKMQKNEDPLCIAEHQNRRLVGQSENAAPGRDTQVERGYGHGSKTTMDMYFHADRDTSRDVVRPPSDPYAHTGCRKKVLHTSADQEGVSKDLVIAFQVNSTRIEGPPATSGVCIPRAHFYGLEAVPEDMSRKMCGISNMNTWKELEGRIAVERKESWKARGPLTHIESLQERIRQKEQEKQRGQENEDDVGRRVANRWEKENQTESMEWNQELGGETKKEVEYEQQGRTLAEKKAVSTEQGENKKLYKIQEGPLLSTSSPLDVRREATVRKPCPQLPGSVSHSLLQSSTGVEETRGTTGAACSSTLTCLPTREGEDEDGQYVEKSELDQQRRRRRDGGGTEEQEEEDSPEEAYDPQCLSPSLTTSSDSSQCPSSPLLPSLVDMSRIYNLKPVVARAPLSIGKSDLPPQSLKVQGKEPRPQIFHSHPQEDCLSQKGETTEKQLQSSSCLEPKSKQWQQGHRGTGEESKKAQMGSAGIRTVQKQVELLKMRDLEDGRQTPSEGTLKMCTQKQPLRDRPTEPPAVELQVHQGQKLQQSTEQHQKEPQQLGQGMHLDDKETFNNQKVPMQQKQKPHLNQSQMPRSFTVNPISSPLREKPSESSESKGASDPSPPASTPVSPFCTPSTALFSLRSASAVQGKRGNTITITPRRSPAGSAPATTSAASRTALSTQTSAPNKDTGKKRYPTVEEIVVIGGYQNLEKSCMAKQGRTHKGVKVCFDEAQLEQVCEYPSESSVLASLPCLLPEPEREGEERVQEQQQEEEEEEEEEEREMFTSSSSGRRAFLRVDESCRQ